MHHELVRIAGHHHLSIALPNGLSKSNESFINQYYLLLSSTHGRQYMASGLLFYFFFANPFHPILLMKNRKGLKP